MQHFEERRVECIESGEVERNLLSTALIDRAERVIELGPHLAARYT
jgi:hypothetical protein